MRDPAATREPNPVGTRYSVLGTRCLKLLFFPALAYWAWLLVKPKPFSDVASRLAAWHELALYVASKGLHFGVYAALAVAAVVGWSRPWRGRMVAVVAAHAVLTELAQHLGNEWYASGRTGSVTDVLIDWAGIAAGLLAARGVRRWRSAPTATPPATDFSFTSSA